MTIRKRSFQRIISFLLLLMFLTVNVTVISTVEALAATDDLGVTIDADYIYQEGYETSVDIESEGAVLLENSGVLPLDEGTKVTVLGSMSYNYVLGGTGSAGGADDINTVMMNEAFLEAGLDVNTIAWNWLAEQCGDSRFDDAFDPAGTGWESYKDIHEFSIDVYESGTDSIVQDGYTDYVVVTFSRSGAEGASPSMDYDGDGSTLTGSTYLELNDNENDLLNYCSANFAHTIVLVNSATPMELGFVDSESYNIDACLWIGHPGEAGIVGVGTILTGRTNPSGHLVDTYAYDMTTNPTYYNTDDNRYTSGQTFYQYEEGIYVGYRYFETADAMDYFDSSDFISLSFKNGVAAGYEGVVQYPFGFGLSYTTFEKSIVDSAVSLEAHGTNTITVEVENTGDVAGKEVVQLYMEAPYQADTENFGIKGVGLEKSKVVLVGFAKTDIMEPGATQQIRISFDTDDLASFDNFGQGCYVMELGDYEFSIQDDAHQWGASGSENPVDAQVSVSLSQSIIFDESGDVAGANYAGARDSDEIIAKNAMNDVTAGDGNMLEGYLSRNDIAGGMKAIMAHQSNEEANEVLDEEVQASIDLTGNNTYEYIFDTYIDGVKTTLTQTIYAHGNSVMPFADTLPDGGAVAELPTYEWDLKYYVLEDGSGNSQLDDNELPVVVDAEPTDGSAYHQLTVFDMVTVPNDTEEGEAIWDMLTEQTSVAEAVEIQGNSGWQVSAVESIGKEAQKCTDGPGEPVNGTMPGATWFPCAVSIAATWNTELAYREGIAYGHQDVLFGVGSAYAPAMNIHRSPFGGRNFEYYSEDGYISGKIGGHAVAGIQSTGTNVFIKHFALNDGDTNRGGNTTWANEQAIREIYLLTYEISCKEFGADGIMGSLNRIGMSWYHYGMYKTILRDEWGWNGYLITDGDGSDGDVYNSAQAMLCVEGSMLARGVYINARSTEAAYGEAVATALGNYALHENMKHSLYQYAGSYTYEGTSDFVEEVATEDVIGATEKDAEEATQNLGVEVGVSSESGGSAMVVIGIIAITLIIVVVVVVVNVRKKK